MSMTRYKWMLCVVLVVAIAGGYVFFSGGRAISGHVEFTRQGADVVLDLPQEVDRVTVKNEAGRMLSVIAVGPGAREKIPIFIRWESDTRYAFELTLQDGRRVVLIGHSPAGGSEKASFVLQVPYGLNNADSIGVVPADSAFTANILLTKYTDQPLGATLDLAIPAGVEVLSVPQGMHTEQKNGVLHIIGQRHLSARNEHWNEQVQLKAVRAGKQSVLEAVVELDDGRERWQMTGNAVIQVASAADISSNIHIQAVEVPVDFTGRLDPKARSGSLVYAPPSTLSRLAGGKGEHGRLDDEPFTYARIQLRNDGDEHVLTLVSAKIIDQASGTLAPAFVSPAHKNAGLGYSYGVVDIAPHAGSQVVLPVYLNENNALSGGYRLRAEVSLFGTNQAIGSTDKEIRLVTRNDRPVIVTLLMALLAVLGVGWLLWRQEAALARFNSKELVIISLFGTVTFIMVNLPETVFWDIARVILGPFSFLFTGFFSQTVLYTLMVALAVVLPRPGAVTLMIIVRFILNGFIFGHFTPLQVLTCAALAVCLEMGLYAAGITRKADTGKVSMLFLPAVACGLVDVVTTYMNFMAYMTLYRLFYADWYITAVIITGFAYTAVGAALGCRLGNAMRRTAMD